MAHCFNPFKEYEMKKVLMCVVAAMIMMVAANVEAGLFRCHRACGACGTCTPAACEPVKACAPVAVAPVATCEKVCCEKVCCKREPVRNTLKAVVNALKPCKCKCKCRACEPVKACGCGCK